MPGTALMVIATTMGLAGLASSFPVFLALRTAGGVGSAMLTVSSLSLLLRVAPRARRAEAAATYQGVAMLGGITGRAVGGFLTDVSRQLPFFLYAAVLLVAGTVAITQLRPAALRGGPVRFGP